VRVTIEGHCDERGTREYNIGLGARRANAVKEYLVSLGVSSGRVDTVSYGKERPICTESNEDCWAQNRRGVTTITGGASS
jgi:peptidoglycan-associated lipoprotein